MMEKSGKFIVLEGISGSGKTLQAKLLAERLPNAVLNVEPTKELFGAVIRAISERRPVSNDLLDECLKYRSSDNDFWPGVRHLINQVKLKLKLSELGMQMLFMADRVYDLKKNIFLNLKSGKTIIQDRYLGSTLAYGYSGGLSIEDLLWFQKEAFESSGILDNSWQPDLLIIFDIEAKIAMERLKDSGKIVDIFEEKLERLEKISEGYFHLAKRTDLARKTVVIAANQKPEDISSQVFQVSNSILTA